MAQATPKTVQQRFVEAWGSIDNPDLDCVNPHFKNKYASLKETQRVIREACRPLGIMYQQRLDEADGLDGTYRLRSFVRSDSGETIELSTFPVETPPNSQAFGSEMTYKKRQQAQADWGIVGEEDEDGEAISASQNQRGASKPAQGRNRAASAAPKPQQASSRQGRWDKLTALKAEALELGITEDGMRGAMDNVLQGKPVKEATDTELKACEGVIASLIGDKKELLAQIGGGDVDQ